MNKIKARNLNRLATLFFCLFIIIGGLFLYRASLKSSDFKQTTGVVETISVKKGYGNRGFLRLKKPSNYAILFNLDSQTKPIGIYAGTLDQAQKKRANLTLNEGESYTFLLDQTVLEHFDGAKLGVRYIIKDGRFLYEENERPSIIFGWIFIFMAFISLFLIRYMAKRKLTKK